jgi:plastocyanin
MKKSLIVIVMASVVTLACVAFAVGAAVSSANHRTKSVADAEPTAPTASSVAPPAGGAAPVEVSIDNFAFGPRDVEAVVGATITWTNLDDVAHSVFTKDGVLGSPDLDGGDTYSFVVDEPGTISYYCDIHQYMSGTITVTP